MFLPAWCLPAPLSILATLFEYLCRAWCSYIPSLIFKSFSTSAMIYQISKLFIFSSFSFVACGAPTILDAAALMKNGEEAQALNRFFQGLKASDPCTGALLQFCCHRSSCSELYRWTGSMSFWNNYLQMQGHFMGNDSWLVFHVTEMFRSTICIELRDGQNIAYLCSVRID